MGRLNYVEAGDAHSELNVHRVVSNEAMLTTFDRVVIALV
jgi:hypothetical protein